MTEEVFKDENAMKHILSSPSLGRAGEPTGLKAGLLYFVGFKLRNRPNLVR
jgi:hypothetical protein